MGKRSQALHQWSPRMTGNGEQTGPKPIPPLLITVRPDGKGVDVVGPIGNKDLFWRMLTDAAMVILNYKKESGIVVPGIVPPKDLLRTQ